MFDKLDRACLRLAERASKWFNWLVGLDNFALARQLIYAFCVYYPVILAMLAVAAHGKNFRVMLFMIPLATFYLWAVFCCINKTQCNKIAEQKRGVKELGMELTLRHLRRTSWTNCALFAVIVAILRCLGARLVEWWLVILPLLLTFLAVVYLISIDKPPYSHSKAWEWLKSFFAIPQAAPALAPIPVPER